MISIYELDTGIKIVMAIWITAMCILSVMMWYYKAESYSEDSISRAERKKKIAMNYFMNLLIEAIMVLTIIKIIEIAINGTYDLFILQQAMIALSLLSFLPILMLILGKPVSDRIFKEVPVFMFTGVAMAGAVELSKFFGVGIRGPVGTFEFSFFLTAEIIFVAVLVVVFFSKWCDFVQKKSMQQ